MTALPAILHEPIQAQLDEGDRLFDRGQFAAALEKYEAARALLPSDPERWEASTWVYTALGDTLFLSRDYAGAHQALQQALRCPQGADNPFINLRLGQCEFELGRTQVAQTILKRAFELGGDDVFEDEDEKYRTLVSGK